MSMWWTPHLKLLFWSDSLLCDQEDVHHSLSIVRRTTQVLCLNIHTPVMGFCGRYVLLCEVLNFIISSLDNLLPSCSATAWIISGQCKSAADSVKNHVGMPKECSIASTSYSSCCQYAGDPLMFFKTLYVCSVHARCLSTVGFCNIPAVIFCPSRVLPRDKQIARLVLPCIHLISEMYCAQKMYSIFWAKQMSTFNKCC